MASPSSSEPLPAPQPEEAKAVPLLGHTHVFVVADSGGFVGSFLSKEHAVESTVKKYPDHPFISYTFALEPTINATSVYVLLYKYLDAVAFVSNDPAAARRAQKALQAVELTYGEALENWRHPTGVVAAAAHTRITAAEELAKLSHEELVTRAEKLEAMLFREPAAVDPYAKITILDCVVPAPLTSEDSADEKSDEAATV